ncbi:hypothetical protein BJX63DRAFT_432223 [Aspergillus granulosus]|uniref:Zn(2)-C6 fungal-type domain-containing protein n=1 Tax=Aspergillus granulosus TaxID=176169 RepID=A0ABR4HCH6_9EURO
MNAKRTHKGCWTCKSRRRKCDRAHPTCLSCSQRGIACEGYGVRLRWGSGIASRGVFAGLDAPVKDAAAGREGEWRKGRRRDLERAGRMQRQQQREQGQGQGQMESVVNGSNPETETGSEGRAADVALKDVDVDEKLFDEFCSSGINILCAGKVDDPNCIFKNHLPVLCRQSEALYRICLALQVLVSPCRSDQFFEYFDMALKRFRLELDRTGAAQLADGTFTAGLLLCTIGMIRGTPWTMHLQGLYNVLLTKGLTSLRWQPTPIRAHLLEVLGIMDLPMLTTGRRSPAFGIWKRYCRDRVDPDGIEVVSGLPKALLDLFSCIDEGTVTEEDFWNWPGAQGTLMECQLWEAYRLAGILTIRYPRLLLPPWAQPSRGVRPELPPTRTLHLPSTDILVTRILSNIDAICRVSTGQEGQKSLILNATQYPVLVAGLQSSTVNGDPELKRVIQRCLSINIRRVRVNRYLYGILEEWWQADGKTGSIHEIAEKRGMELGLF